MERVCIVCNKRKRIVCAACIMGNSQILGNKDTSSVAAYVKEGAFEYS